MSVYCRLRKQMLSSRTSRLLRSRRLSASHKGRFKGSHLPILCKIQLLEFHRNFCITTDLHSCGGLLENWLAKVTFDQLWTQLFICMCHIYK